MNFQDFIQFHRSETILHERFQEFEEILQDKIHNLLYNHISGFSIREMKVKKQLFWAFLCSLFICGPQMTKSFICLAWKEIFQIMSECIEYKIEFVHMCFNFQILCKQMCVEGVFE